MIVSPECYKVFASILNDFGQERSEFTFADFVQAAKSIGFNVLDKHEQGLIPPRRFGNQIFRLMPKNCKMDRVVSADVQDEWKKEFYRLYGWTAYTFRRRQRIG
ncbi:hypothetical protein LXA43DRAFT_1101951 [Ganoderma leucocontextum]|nr:hypothetical protein LXA43DRAFT_1101951 [Ganoderma leucocontextum]